MPDNPIPHAEVEMLLRLSLAAVAGGAIGWNRYITGKPAGIRTHMLVALGAALFTIVPLEAGLTAADITRVIQGIAAGVGFLGAGEIFREQTPRQGSPAVHGLTSAAAIWVTAGIGILAACGMWLMSLFGTLLALVILSVAARLERILPVHHEE